MEEPPRPILFRLFRKTISGELLQKHRFGVVAIQTGDVIDADFLGAGGFALVLVGAVTKALGIHLADHGEDTFLTLRLALRQMPEVGNLRRDEQHRGSILARSNASTATDAGGGIKGGIRIFL